MEFAIKILEEQKQLLSDELKEIYYEDLERLETEERLRNVTKALDNLTSSSRIIHSQPQHDFYYWVKDGTETEYEVALFRSNFNDGEFYIIETGWVNKEDICDWHPKPIPNFKG